MLHPSYTELMEKINSTDSIGEEPAINSRYSIVIATAKRARQLIAGDEPLVKAGNGEKPLSVAVKELYDGDIKILPEDEPFFSEDIDFEDDAMDFDDPEEDMAPETEE